MTRAGKTVAGFVLLILVAALIGSSSFSDDDNTNPYFFSFQEAQTAAAENGRPILIDFYTDW